VRIAVIADTHLPRGRRRLPERCAEIIAESELVIHAGDIATSEVLAELRAIGPPLHAVHGNVDSFELRRELPEVLELELGGVRIGCLHDPGPARGRLQRLRGRFAEADAVIFGHTHMPQLEGEDGFQIFNPGSPTERRRAPYRSMGLASVEAGRIEFSHLDLD
jgi:hypothetical protein